MPLDPYSCSFEKLLNWKLTIIWKSDFTCLHYTATLCTQPYCCGTNWLVAYIVINVIYITYFYYNLAVTCVGMIMSLCQSYPEYREYIYSCHGYYTWAKPTIFLTNPIRAGIQNFIAIYPHIIAPYHYTNLPCISPNACVSVDGRILTCPMREWEFNP